ncbi:MAG: TRAP transporter substrate-binding protein [Maritimibacter sp.]|nr:TRAP transporter substrate-binding protein [Maritimibacter sp.]
MKPKTALVIATAAAAMALAAPAASAEIELKLAHFLPTANGMHSDFMEPWARDLEACSGGAVAVEIFPAGTQLGNPAKLYDEVRAGVVDIASGLSGIPGGRFERVRIAELPFIFDDAGTATQTLWALFDDHFAQEFPDVKVLALHAHNPGGFHTVSAPVSTPADLAGLRLRFPTEATNKMIEALGGTPVGLPPGAVYENAEKGVIDGAVFTWDTMASFKLAEVMKHHFDARAYVTTFWFAINRKTYDGLPEAVRTCVDQLSGETLTAKFGDWWNSWDEAGLAAVQGADHTIVTPTEAERQVWIDTLAPMVDAFLADMEARGIDDAREIYDAMKAAAEAQ